MTTQTQTSPTTRIYEGDVVSIDGKSFYVTASSRGSLQMLSLPGLKGYSGKVGTGLIKRFPTQEEHEQVSQHLYKAATEMAKFGPGTLVIYLRPQSKEERGLHVVTSNNEKSVTLYPVGGSKDGRYMRTPRHLITVVDPTDVLR